MHSRRAALLLIAAFATAGCSSNHAATGAPTIPPAGSTASTNTPASNATSTRGKPSTTRAGAHVDISVTATVTAREVVLHGAVDGVVPQLSDQMTGQPVTGKEQELNTRVDYGDGSPPVGSDGGSVACRGGAPLVPLHLAWGGRTALTHTYASRGTYTVTFTVRVCALGNVSHRFEVSAR